MKSLRILLWVGKNKETLCILRWTIFQRSQSLLEDLMGPRDTKGYLESWISKIVDKICRRWNKPIKLWRTQDFRFANIEQEPSEVKVSRSDLKTRLGCKRLDLSLSNTSTCLFDFSWCLYRWIHWRTLNTKTIKDPNCYGLITALAMSECPQSGLRWVEPFLMTAFAPRCCDWVWGLGSIRAILAANHFLYRIASPRTQGRHCPALGRAKANLQCR